jgi:hypothetical protein
MILCVNGLPLWVGKDETRLPLTSSLTCGRTSAGSGRCLYIKRTHKSFEYTILLKHSIFIFEIQ